MITADHDLGETRSQKKNDRLRFFEEKAELHSGSGFVVPLGDQGQFLAGLFAAGVAVVLPGLICATRIQNISSICSPPRQRRRKREAATN
jgi:hypothetical protein